MALTLRTNTGSTSRQIARDPFHMARELLSWDPIFGGRPASAFSPAFSRSFSLPDIADGDRIDANLTAGVLTLSIAKKAEAKPRKIALKKS